MATHSIIPNPANFIENCEKRYGIAFSSAFIDCANSQLTPFVENQLKVKVTENVYLGFINPAEQDFIFRAEWAMSSFSCELRVNDQAYPVSLCWKSNSAKFYKINDTDIDCSDIVFWLEDSTEPDNT